MGLARREPGKGEWMMDNFDWEQCNARIEHLILVPAAISQGEYALPDVFAEEFCDNLPERDDAPLYKQLPPLAQFRDGEEWPGTWMVVEALEMAQCKGFLIQAAQPVVRDFSKDGNGFSYSWGHYHTEWLYAETADQIPVVVAEWSDATLSSDRALSKAGEQS